MPRFMLMILLAAACHRQAASENRTSSGKQDRPIAESKPTHDTSPGDTATPLGQTAASDRAERCTKAVAHVLAIFEAEGPKGVQMDDEARKELSDKGMRLCMDESQATNREIDCTMKASTSAEVEACEESR